MGGVRRRTEPLDTASTTVAAPRSRAATQPRRTADDTSGARTAARDAYAERTGPRSRIRPEVVTPTPESRPGLAAAFGRTLARAADAVPADAGALPERRSRVPPRLRPAATPTVVARPSIERPDPRAVGILGRSRTGGHFSGPTVRPDEMNEATESRLLAAHGGTGVLAAYGGFDPSRPPAVLVHGIDGGPHDLQDMARELDARGMQVLVFMYDDIDTTTHASGDQLAAELGRLRGEYPDATSLSIFAHSMGGIVTRGALNTLAQPGWYDGTTRPGANPLAGFSDVRVRTLDTAWTGYPHEPPLPLMSEIVENVMASTGHSSGIDMRGNSQMFQHLFDVPLGPNVDLQNTAAHQIRGLHAPDGHRSVHDMNPAQQRQLWTWLDGGPPPTDEAARHLAQSLQQDSRFTQLSSAARRALASGDETDLATLVDAVMPSEAGTHTGVLRERPHRRDAVDRIADELTP